MRISKRQLLLRILVPVLAIYAAFLGFIWWSMRQPPEVFGKVMAKMPEPVVFLLAPFEFMWTHARAGSLDSGDLAPDFSLVKLDKSGQMQLSSIVAQEPVVLVFGSYT